MDDVTLQIFLCVALEGMVKQRNVLFHFGGVVVQLKPMGGDNTLFLLYIGPPRCLQQQEWRPLMFMFTCSSKCLLPRVVVLCTSSDAFLDGVLSQEDVWADLFLFRSSAPAVYLHAHILNPKVCHDSSVWFALQTHNGTLFILALLLAYRCLQFVSVSYV